MATIDRSAALSKQKVPAGTVLAREGGENSSLLFLHSGLASLEANGTRIGLAKGESLCSAPPLGDAGNARYTVQTRTECIISNVPLGSISLPQLLAGKPALAVQTLRSLIGSVESAGFLLRNYKYLWHKVASIADAIALANDFGPEIFEPSATPRTGSSLANYSAYLRSRETPAAWDPGLFAGAVQNKLELYAENDAVTIDSLVDLGQFRFLKAMLGKPAQTLGPLFARENAVVGYPYGTLTGWLAALTRENERLARETSTLLDQLFTEDGWVQSVTQAIGASSEGRPFGSQLAAYCGRVYKDAVNLLGRDLKTEFPIYQKLRAFAKKAQAVQAAHSVEEQASGNLSVISETADEPPTAPAGPGLAKYQGLMKQILEFAGWPEEERDAFTALMTKWKQHPEKLDDSKEYVHLRTQIASKFWQLYEECYLKIVSTDLKSFVPGIMLHFGLLDETLVSQEELVALDQAYSENLFVSDPIPTMTLPYFLEKVFQDEVRPSMSEMGEDFAKVIKNQEKMSKKERDGVYIYKDTPEDRVRYEIRQIAAYTAPLLYGSRRRYAAPLCSASMVGKAERLILRPEELAAQIDEFRTRDFGVFTRDLGLHHKFGTDIIQKEVLPNFVIYPNAGSRMMMWQELDGTSRHSPGRMFVPLFFNERKEEALLTMLAQYRWELQKTVAGANWMDPVEGGLVGSYYDYINFYQKNHRLSAEAKERIKTMVKRTRSDRDRFASDYIDWVLHEYDGKIRLNPVAREIFYRFCPFPEQMRSEMEKKPLYADLEHKYQNRQRKALLKIETRVKRFEKEGEPLPEDLAHHLEFLKA
ncbi:MAG: hypothetical protein ACLFNT_04895 [Spirochaetales bacterium]